MGKGDVRDLLLYFAFIAVPIAIFLLQDYSNAMFFTALLVVNLVVWVWGLSCVWGRISARCTFGVT